MTTITPRAGATHDLVLSYGNPSSPTLIGLMLPDLKQFTAQPYTPFAPAARQGEATQRDFNISSVWELINTWEAGTAHVNEGDAEEQGYNFAQGQDLTGTTTIGPCLYTAQPGKVLPPPAETVSTTTFSNVKQFILFNGNLYALTSDAAGKVYKHNGTTWTLVETLTAAGKQLYTDGTTLYATQGSSNFVRKTTNGTAWSNDTFNADFVALREEGNLAYIYTNGANTAELHPGITSGPTYRTPNVGWYGTAATSMAYNDNALYIGKPEGLYMWSSGKITRLVNAEDQFDTSNFSKFVIHKNLLYFNIKNRLYFAARGQNARMTEVVPEDQKGFTHIDSLAASFGPLFVGARLQSRSYLFMFEGVDAPGLHPLWSDADAARPITAVMAADIYGAPLARVYFCQTTTGIVYMDLTQRFLPNTYHTKGTTQSYLDLIEFSAGFRTIPKWFYEIVLNVRNPVATTFAQLWYSIDGGAWTQTLDENGAAVTLTLSSANKAAYLPLNTTGIKIQVRLYLWTTNSSTVAEVTAITVRGTVMVKRRNQFSFPVKCDQEVRGLQGDIIDTSRNILAALRSAATQGYPCKIQDPDGNWHLVLFREPYPLEATKSKVNPNVEQPVEQYKVVQCLLVEIDALSATGGLLAWSAG